MADTVGLLQTLSYTLWIGLILFNNAQGEQPTPKSAMRAIRCVIPNGKEHLTRAALFQQCISDNYGQGNETRCYEELGCFPLDYPWTSLLRPLPSPLHPAEINTQLYCYTRDTPERFNISLWPDISLGGCPLNVDKPTMFLSHGFSSDGNNTWMSDLKDRYLDAVDANVVLVDWGRGAQLLNYLQVASNTRIVGAEVARFIRYLQHEHGLNTSSLHLIGHSLGSHIVSYAAKNVTGVNRLTALDPAQPGFEGTDSEVRLDKEDADYVEVVHTNAAPFLPTLGFGLMLPHGDVDFYMNGGVRQPGCAFPDVTEIKSLTDLAKYPVELVNSWVSCSHGRSYEYFTQSLQNNCTIWGRLSSLARHLFEASTFGLGDPVISQVESCDTDSCIPLGLETPEYAARGVFVASTPRRSPFCNDPDENDKILSDMLKKSTKNVKAVSGVASGKAEDVAKNVATSLGGDKVQDVAKGLATSVSSDKAEDVAKGVATSLGGDKAQDVAKGLASSVSSDKAEDVAKGVATRSLENIATVNGKIGNLFSYR